jgi:sterol desaturase/sphingolipid hydroxylase (fatty acid hydroxylase superfamily)
MDEVILYAIPIFVICIILEAAAFYLLPDDDGPQQRLGYDKRDTATSLSMGIGNVLVNIGWKLVVVAAYTGAYLLAPFHLPADNPLTWIALFVADDFAYYWYHRTHHEIRVFWASHVVHHSSERYNLSTALRQPWTPFSSLPFWLALAFLGFAPWMILLQQSISLLYQFFIHTERIGTLWRPIEFVMNTPSHHRVHHGSNTQYLDRNYGGIMIIWDRMFGTFEAEDERVRYGLTKNIDTYNPLRVATHEWVAIWRDLRRAKTWRARVGHLFGRPGGGLEQHAGQAGQEVPGGEIPDIVDGFDRVGAGQ